jgi:hypothetical protein
VRLAALGGAAALLITGCAHAQDRPATARFTESGVEVTINVTRPTVRATYRPIRPGFHVYSIDLPPGGVAGLGVPTRLGVRAGLTATGRATADRAVRVLVLPALNVKLPVYPDGPVTVSLPVHRSGRTADIVVSYGACSSSTCLAPVIDHVTRISL